MPTAAHRPALVQSAGVGSPAPVFRSTASVSSCDLVNVLVEVVMPGKRFTVEQIVAKFPERQNSFPSASRCITFR